MASARDLLMPAAVGALAGAIGYGLARQVWLVLSSSNEAPEPRREEEARMDALVRRSLGRAIRAGAGESALRDEQMSRSRQFFDDGQDRIEGAFVVVVGMGGVGSHAANMMVRGGLGRLRCIDFDNVSLSSLNRHATATRAEVGEPKVKAFRDHLLKVCPWCEIEAVSAIFRGEDADRLLAGKPDLVIDCIDDTATKAQLLMACDRLGLECVSSLGAGGKSDPTRIHVAQLDDCVVDPLASKLRYRLRYEIREQLCAKEAAGSASAPAKATETAAEGPPAPSAKPAVTAAATDTASGPASTLEADRAHDAVVTEIASRILTRTHAVYSSERPVKSLMPLAEAQAENPDQFGLLAGFRLRIIPVLGTMPALLGQAIAGHALCLLAKKPIREPFVAPRQGLAAVTSMTNKCRGRERRTFKSEDHSTINSRVTNGVCEFHYNHVWLARCALDGTPPGSKARLLLRRWYSSKPACLDNLILVDDRVASRLDEEGTGWVPEELKRKVEGRLAWVRAVASADKRGDEDSARQMELALARAGVETVEELTAVAPARVEAAKPVSEDEWLWTGLYLGCGIVVGAVGALSVRQ